MSQLPIVHMILVLVRALNVSRSCQRELFLRDLVSAQGGRRTTSSQFNGIDQLLQR